MIVNRIPANGHFMSRFVVSTGVPIIIALVLKRARCASKLFI
jgi:hypothetical protein